MSTRIQGIVSSSPWKAFTSTIKPKKLRRTPASAPVHRVRSAMTLSTGAYLIPHPRKVETGGEDAYFVNGGVLAIADGVSGFSCASMADGLKEMSTLHCFLGN